MLGLGSGVGQRAEGGGGVVTRGCWKRPPLKRQGLGVRVTLGAPREREKMQAQAEGWTGTNAHAVCVCDCASVPLVIVYEFTCEHQ